MYSLFTIAGNYVKRINQTSKHNLKENTKTPKFTNNKRNPTLYSTNQETKPHPLSLSQLFFFFFFFFSFFLFFSPFLNSLY